MFQSSRGGVKWPPLPLPVGAHVQVKVIWQKAPHGGPIPWLGVTPGGESYTIEFFG